MTSKTPPRVMTIAGTDSGGGAGIAADLRALAACGVHGCLAVTAVTVQNSVGVTGVHTLPPETVAAQIEAVATDIGLDAAKTGMLATSAIIEAIAAACDRVGIGADGPTPFVVDPVAASDARRPAAGRRGARRLPRTAVPRATLVTPNLDEVRLLVGRRRARPGRAVRGGQAAARLGPRYVLVKGGHLVEDVDVCVDLLYDGHTFTELSGPRFATGDTHGGGDNMASAHRRRAGARAWPCPRPWRSASATSWRPSGTPTRSARATARCRRCGRSIRGGSGDTGPGLGSGSMSELASESSAQRRAKRGPSASEEQR